MISYGDENTCYRIVDGRVERYSAKPRKVPTNAEAPRELRQLPLLRGSRAPRRSVPSFPDAIAKDGRGLVRRVRSNAGSGRRKEGSRQGSRQKVIDALLELSAWVSLGFLGAVVLDLL